MEVRSVAQVVDCFGCGVCATICAKNAIKIEINLAGFYEPTLDTTKCIDCGLCAEVCAFLHDDLAVQNNPISSYGAWSNNIMVRRRCSSGGVAYELGKHMLNKGYKVCAVRYNPIEQRAEHYIAINEKEFMPSIGSKYIQSYTVAGFKAINRREKYIVTGTPCQIDSFRRYINKFKIEDNFVLLDFFCHSVPSLLAWKKYLQIVEKKTGPIFYASWRNKYTGWHDSWAMAIDGYGDAISCCDKVDSDGNYDVYNSESKHLYNSRFSKGDIFYKLFLGDYCCSPACQNNCKYKYDKSSADIRIGDFWGPTYAENEDGVSSVVAFTDKGNEVLSHIDCTFEEHPFDIVAEGQMTKNVGKHFLADVVSFWLKLSKTNEFIIKSVFMIDWLWRFPKRVVVKLKSLLK